MNKNWIAIDWGTSNFRAFLMDENRCTDSVSAPCGLMQVHDRQFAAALQTLIQPWLDQSPQLPVLMAGMVGSQQGWCEAPYVSLPAGGEQLARHTAEITTPWGSPCRIVPGACCDSTFGLPDVMRGEEVQLIGLAALYPQADHCVILPGTHSKHAELHQGKILRFSTYMTGEIYAVMLGHSLLGRDLPQAVEDDAAFTLGVQNARLAPCLSNALFSARTLRLNGTLTPAQVPGYLSGLLIGAELLQLPAKEAWIVGSPTLNGRYHRAAILSGIQLHPADGNDCFIRGMSQIYQKLNGEQL
ncbi:2-dehydro-3-deoxygalactonokinase [Rahnella woolbedingensis]|uniref:2-dehydro-3-deoxygalactonokinase n=1 Tax=Rahnella woolbedingensis TaxID=1510574 RepID=A0A419NBH2_9GAMM|nr:2-dehydro-3-deoxygalactonokinase [Rahnella woolbedingensis]RJT45420.1 2-dehydro-3-deoxygalactonokinase [Rahnella woolbedingensis]